MFSLSFVLANVLSRVITWHLSQLLVGAGACFHVSYCSCVSQGTMIVDGQGGGEGGLPAEGLCCWRISPITAKSINPSIRCQPSARGGCCLNIFKNECVLAGLFVDRGLRNSGDCPIGGKRSEKAI